MVKATIYFCIFVIVFIGTSYAMKGRQFVQNDIIKVNEDYNASKTLDYLLDKGTMTHILHNYSGLGFIGELFEIIGLAKTIFEFIDNIVDLIKKLSGKGESQELKDLLKNMAVVNEKLTAIAYELDDIEKLIEWSGELIKVWESERQVMHLARELDMLLQMPNKTSQMQEFINRCNGDDKNGVHDLFSLVTERDPLTGDNILDKASWFSRYNRTFVQTFSKAFLALLVKGFQIDIACLEAKGEHTNAQFLQKKYTEDICKAAFNMSDMDLIVKQKYSEQYPDDIDRFATVNTGLSQKMFNDKLFQYLQSKYYWRQWLTITYKSVNKGKNFDRHYTELNDTRKCSCDGVIR